MEAGQTVPRQSLVKNYFMALHRLEAVDLPISGAVARQAGLCHIASPTANAEDCVLDRLLAA
jgi:hypothetical protein